MSRRAQRAISFFAQVVVTIRPANIYYLYTIFRWSVGCVCFPASFRWSFRELLRICKCRYAKGQLRYCISGEHFVRLNMLLLYLWNQITGLNPPLYYLHSYIICTAVGRNAWSLWTPSHYILQCSSRYSPPTITTFQTSCFSCSLCGSICIKPTRW